MKYKSLLSAIFILLFFAGCKKQIIVQTVVKYPLTTMYTDSINSFYYDSRQAETGARIFQDAYVDEPYILQLNDGSWLCAYTQGPLAEGSWEETIGISKSYDSGQSWKQTGVLEADNNNKTDGAAFYAIPFLTSYGRIYIIYGYNYDNIRVLNGQTIRTDAVGHMVYKYSDDNGATWSARNTINMPVTQYDLGNEWHGTQQMWWSVCKPILSADDQMYFSFTKIEKYPYITGEGWFVNCPNINQEQDTSKLVWNFLPMGDIGLRSATMGATQQEHNIVQLSNGSFCCIFRTDVGYPAVCYSSDNCHTWSKPQPLTFGPNNYVAKNPVACARIFKFPNGKYLLWFENNDNPPKAILTNRNPAWVLGGTELNGVIKWSQPDVLLYSRDTTQGFSYPDINEVGGNYYLSQTQKRIARLNQIDTSLLSDLWGQGTKVFHKTQFLAGNLNSSVINQAVGQNFAINPNTIINGLAMNLVLDIHSFNNTDQPIISSISTDNVDTLIKLRLTSSKTLAIDVFYKNSSKATTLYCDNNLITLNTPLFISVSMDAHSGLLCAMVNGILCNGNPGRLAGWAIVPQLFNFGNISNNIHINKFEGSATKLQIYNIPFTTSQMVEEYLAWKSGMNN